MTKEVKNMGLDTFIELIDIDVNDVVNSISEDVWNIMMNTVTEDVISIVNNHVEDTLSEGTQNRYGDIIQDLGEHIINRIQDTLTE